MAYRSTQDEVRLLLRASLAQAQLRSPGYSLRAFSKRLNTSSAALSEMLGGKRTITRKQAEKFFQCLAVPPDTRSRILNSLNNRRNEKSEIKKSEYKQIPMDEFHLVGDWFYFAILSLADTKNWRGEAVWVSKRLGISQKVTTEALARLERLGLLKRSKSGHLIATGVQYTTSQDIASVALRKHHAENLELARLSLENDSVEDRDFSFMSLAVNPKLMPKMKQRLREFRRSFADEFEVGERSEVFRLCIQLFQLTKDTEG